ncbi:hypothetical protein Pla52n_50510 [Stieleria varia]|uniref:Uncharacterized protein n=1 Tax=Stieleria varia TaxID=2528005 RepID=A0A5C6AH82_9BACT|nr:hypothetical protein Pla52n_50510 [Stieleria varia]
MTPKVPRGRSSRGSLRLCRWQSTAGEKHRNAKLTDDDDCNIRESKLSDCEQSKKYQVHKTTTANSISASVLFCVFVSFRNQFFQVRLCRCSRRGGNSLQLRDQLRLGSLMVASTCHRPARTGHQWRTLLHKLS